MTMSIVATTLVSLILGGWRMTLEFAVGAGIVLVSQDLYRNAGK
jgi:hypothetical protein